MAGWPAGWISLTTLTSRSPDGDNKTVISVKLSIPKSQNGCFTESTDHSACLSLPFKALKGLLEATFLFYLQDGLSKVVLSPDLLPLALILAFWMIFCPVHTDGQACLSSLKACWSPLSSYSFKMLFLLKLFIGLICFHSFSSHLSVPVFEDNEDINDGRTGRM